jgi:hypothetical protein
MIGVGNGPVDTIDEAYPCAGAAAICIGICEGMGGPLPGNSIGLAVLSALSRKGREIIQKISTKGREIIPGKKKSSNGREILQAKIFQRKRNHTKKIPQRR